MSYLEVVKNPIIGELLKKGINMSLFADGLVLEGFYKSGTISLTVNQDGQLYAHSRYGRSEKIESLEDLVILNIAWWRYSRDRNPSWSVPAEPWATMAIEMKLLTKTVREVVEYK